MKKALAALMACVLIIAGCGTVREAEDDVMDISPVVDQDANDKKTVTLYFGDAGMQRLVGEVRTLSVPVNERIEETALKAIVAGPLSDSSEFVKLLNSKTEVVSVRDTDGVLFVTLGAAFLNWPQTAGADEPVSDGQKQLAVYSIVNTLIELSGCESVQLLIDNSGSGMGQRIQRSLVGFGEEGVLEPLTRNGEIVLTPGNTVRDLLQYMQQKDYDGAYRYIAQNDVDLGKRPLISAFEDAMTQSSVSVESFEVTETVVSADGSEAVVMINCALRTGSDTEARMRTNIPVMVMRENDIWKVRYSTLRSVLLME